MDSEGHVTCFECRFFLPQLPEEDGDCYSICRRHAPVKTDKTEWSIFGYPQVKPKDWCGDWEAKEDGNG